MTGKVKLADIMEGMDFEFADSKFLVNIKTGEVVFVYDKQLRDAEDGDPYDTLPDWQQEEMELAYDIIENEDKYVDLPSQFDINEYGMMEDFCFTVKDSDARKTLLQDIRGKGAFRRFKDRVSELGIVEDWYEYRDACYRQIAIDFCKQHGLEYTE